MQHPDPWANLQELIDQVKSQSLVADAGTQASGNEDQRGNLSINTDPYREWATAYGNQSAIVYRASSAHNMDRYGPAYSQYNSYYSQQMPSDSGAQGGHADYNTYNPSRGDQISGQLYHCPAHKSSETLSAPSPYNLDTTSYVPPANAFSCSSNWSPYQPLAYDSSFCPSLLATKYDDRARESSEYSEKRFELHQPSRFAAFRNRPTPERDFSATFRGTTYLSSQERTSGHKENASRKPVMVPFTDQHIRQLSTQLRSDHPRAPKVERTRDAEAFLNDPENLVLLQQHHRQKTRSTVQAPPAPKNPPVRFSSANVQGPISSLSSYPRSDRYKPSTTFGADRSRPKNNVSAVSPDYANIIGYLHNLCQQQIHSVPKYEFTQDEQGQYNGFVAICGRVFATEQPCTTIQEAKTIVARTALSRLKRNRVLGSRVDKSFASLSTEEKSTYRLTQLKNWTTKRGLPDPEYSIERDPAYSNRFFGLAKAAFQKFRSQRSFNTEREAMASVACLALGWFCQREGMEYWKRLQADLAAAPWEVEKEWRMPYPCNIVQKEQNEENLVPPPVKEVGPKVGNTKPIVVVKEGRYLTRRVSLQEYS